ncbi:MAG: glycoside hydrolase family 20, partial [Deltaproteobacteria bacterium]|nr:glycoside hydrolase family 20 [Deltaproteobacteria bacterium]
MKYKDIVFYYSSSNIEFPLSGDILRHIKSTDKDSEAQIVFTIDELLDIPDEGYKINITNKRIDLTGKDKAGLFYALKTLEQLLQDSKEQNVYLPLCSIQDYPLL